LGTRRNSSQEKAGQALALGDAAPQCQDDFIRRHQIGTFLDAAAAGQALRDIGHQGLIQIDVVVQQGLGQGDLAARHHRFLLQLGKDRTVRPAGAAFDALFDLVPVVFDFLMLAHSLVRYGGLSLPERSCRG
jgi:hypothetical protein